VIRILDSWRGDFSDEDFKIWFDKLNEVPLGKEGLLTCGMQYNAFTDSFARKPGNLQFPG